jgi:hypothetical protein
MTVQQARTVDWLGIEKETGNIMLTVVDDLDCGSEDDHLLALQDKLNTYLAFIESEEVFDRLVDTVRREVARTTPIKVSVLAKYPLTPKAESFIQHAKKTFHDAGFQLVHNVVVVPSEG